MKIKLIITLSFTSFLYGCMNSVIDTRSNTEREIDPGNIPINYYSDKTVKSLVVPPDLTKPDAQNSFRISEFVNGINENVIDFTSTEEVKDKNIKILTNISEIQVKRSGQRRWLVIKKDSDTIWEIAKDFLKEQGFTIKKSNKNIGIIETDFLENYPDIPEKSLGFIRSMISKALTARYTLPIIDKYRVRVEPIDNNNTELHLSLFSMQEKLAQSGNIETTIWEAYEKDIALETEMLYRLMLYIGGNKVDVKEKILKAQEEKTIKTNVVENFNGYAKLVFEANVIDSWDNLNWAFDQLNIEIEDKDLKEKSFYIKAVRTADLGIMSSLLGTDSLVKTFQIILKDNGKDETEIFFNDISGENEQETKDYSFEFFQKIQKLF